MLDSNDITFIYNNRIEVSQGRTESITVYSYTVTSTDSYTLTPTKSYTSYNINAICKQPVDVSPRFMSQYGLLLAESDYIFIINDIDKGALDVDKIEKVVYKSKNYGVSRVLKSGIVLDNKYIIFTKRIEG